MWVAVSLRQYHLLLLLYNCTFYRECSSTLIPRQQRFTFSCLLTFDSNSVTTLQIILLQITGYCILSGIVCTDSVQTSHCFHNWSIVAPAIIFQHHTYMFAWMNALELLQTVPDGSLLWVSLDDVDYPLTVLEWEQNSSDACLCRCWEAVIPLRNKLNLL